MKKYFDSKRIIGIFVLIFSDALIVTVSGGLALLVRFDFSFKAIPSLYVTAFIKFLPIEIYLVLAMFLLLRMYRYIWRSISVQDVASMILSVAGTYIVIYLVSVALSCDLPRSVCFMGYCFGLILLVGIRCSFRFIQAARTIARNLSKDDSERIMLIGAGEAGRVLAREYHTSSQVSGKICCFIDDNKTKWDKYLESVKIVGGRDEIPQAVKRYNITQIIFAIPSASPKEKKDILDVCKRTDCTLKSLPGVYQLVNGEVSIAGVREVQVEDLLSRESVRLNTDEMDAFLKNKTVLVTGGGGSIGSELCRQIAQYHPKSLIILDIYENNAYEIQQELKRRYGDTLTLHMEIASIRDKQKMYDLFSEYRPDVVFHAAAHKHVPLMESCPEEAIKNNIFGTYHVIRAAEKYGVKKFVMISTDKAVNPTNIMGATKRFCEMIIQSRNESDTEFCAVRFGNVLGSNGSVVPLFKKQIENGGPITITDKRITRFFMSIPEAAQLVMKAGAMAKQNQIFVLDMGEPVKILSLAENLIRLSGLKPYRDVDIVEVGLRPGEKLYEELLMKNERLLKTADEKIFIEEDRAIPAEDIMQALIALDNLLECKVPNDELISFMRTIVPTYRAPEEINLAKREVELVAV